MEAVVQTLSRSNRLPGAARDKKDEDATRQKERIVWTHLQSNFRAYGFDKSTRMLARLFLL
jgi:hypothetical protein